MNLFHQYSFETHGYSHQQSAAASVLPGSTDIAGKDVVETACFWHQGNGNQG